MFLRYECVKVGYSNRPTEFDRAMDNEALMESHRGPTEKFISLSTLRNISVSEGWLFHLPDGVRLALSNYFSVFTLDAYFLFTL